MDLLAPRTPIVGTHLPVYAYTTLSSESWDVGNDRLLVDTVQVQSTVTRVINEFQVAVLQFGQYNVVGGVGPVLPLEQSKQMTADLKDSFLRADITALYRLFDQYFASGTFDLPSLFRDQQSEVIAKILDATMEDVEAFSQQLYQRNASLIRYLMSLDLDLPSELLRTVKWVQQNEIHRALNAERFNRKQIKMLFHEAHLLNVPLDHAQLTLGLQDRVLSMAKNWAVEPLNHRTLLMLSDTTRWVRSLPFEVDLYKVQNLFYRIRKELIPVYQKRLDSPNPDEKRWSQNFATLNKALHFQEI